MSKSKHFDKIAWGVTALMLVFTILFMNGLTFGIEAKQRTMGYETRLFDNTKVHAIDITMNQWDELIENAVSEEYYTADIKIDGESYKNVGIRAKGNTSLSTVATLNSERYSFKIEFDHYDSTKSYYGLDKMSLNNLIQDSTMMKDYLTYTMMQEFGVNSSLCSFVYITVNGEDWGLYLAVEGVEDAFLQRNYGSDFGNLYKPDSLSFGADRQGEKDFSNKEMPQDFNPQSMFENQEMPNEMDMAQLAENFNPDSMFGEGHNGGGFGGGMGSSDVKLQYIDDEIDSYSNIWDNAKTNIKEKDQTRLIESLKKLSANEQLESVVDIEQVIRYFVVHNYVCNGDSYTGSMVHNYYLYEKDGRLAMIPWDYNLAFGTFQGSNAQSIVNTPIDDPIEGGSAEDRPMWNWIVANEEYTALYHEYFAEFLETVDIISIIDNAYELIKPYVEKDPTAFYTFEEFELGVQTIRQFCQMRSESICMQLENGQTDTNNNYVDASAITLSDMGSMGGEKGGFGQKMPDNFGDMENLSAQMPENMGDMQSFNQEKPENRNGMENFDAQRPENMGDMQNFTGEKPEDADDMQSFNQEKPENINGMENFNAEKQENTDDTESFDKQMPFGEKEFHRNDTEPTASNGSGFLWIGISIVILATGLIIALKYR